MFENSQLRDRIHNIYNSIMILFQRLEKSIKINVLKIKRLVKLVFTNIRVFVDS